MTRHRYEDTEPPFEVGPKTKFTTTVRTAISAILFVGMLISGYFIFEGKLQASADELAEVKVTQQLHNVELAEHDKEITTISAQLADQKELLVQILSEEQKRDREPHYVGPRSTP